MADENERIMIEMTTAGRLRLDGQTQDLMQANGYRAYDYDALDLGFHLPTQWPLDPQSEVTVAQLVVLSIKLNLQFIFADPMVQAGHKESKGN